MEIPRKPGIYFVSLSGSELAPIDHNPVRHNVCIKVNDLNSKFGQAKNLHQRFRSYQKTFGTDRVVYRVLLCTDSASEVERRLKYSFKAFMIPGPTGRLHEWLQGITPEDAFRRASDICAAHNSLADQQNLAFSAQEACTKSQPIAHATQVPEISARAIIQALEYLQHHKFPRELSVRLHHSQKRTENVDGALKYFHSLTGEGLRHKNTIYGHRLIFISEKHQQQVGTFAALTDLAVQEYPV